MNYKEAKTYFQSELSWVLDASELEAIFNRCIEHITQKTKIECLTTPEIQIPDATVTHYIQEILTGKPIQYILGFEWFGHLKLVVNEAVLIPRPETEELCIWVLDFIKENNLSNPTILDIGTGSGCIPIYLAALLKDTTILAMDKSQKALEVAQYNAHQYQITIPFFEDDILNPTLDLYPEVDILISNPPYILKTESVELADRVVKFEPGMALFVTNEDPLQFYKALIKLSALILKKEGSVFMEVHQDFALETEQMFIDNGFSTVLRQDMYGNLRMLQASKNK